PAVVVDVACTEHGALAVIDRVLGSVDDVVARTAGRAERHGHNGRGRQRCGAGQEGSATTLCQNGASLLGSRFTTTRHCPTAPHSRNEHYVMQRTVGQRSGCDCDRMATTTIKVS